MFPRFSNLPMLPTKTKTNSNIQNTHNSYPITEINSTYQPNENLNSNSEEDVLYQRGASFSAELDMNNNSIVLDNTSKKQDTKSSESISKATQVENDHSKIDYDYGKGKCCGASAAHN